MSNPPRLIHLLERARARVLQEANAALRPLGISAAQAGVLFHLISDGPSRLGDLARALDVRETALSGLIGRMAQSGLIRLDSDPMDGRARLATITDEGRARGQGALDLLAHFNAQMAATIGTQDLEAAGRALQALADGLIPLSDADARIPASEHIDKPRTQTHD